MTKKITAIIPIGATSFEFYERRLNMRLDYDLDEVETLIVNDGSPDDVSELIEDYCNRHGFKYVRTSARHTPFSSARARNVGLQYSDTEWVSLEDADVIYPRNFYTLAIQQLELLEDVTPFNFLTIPTVYLKETISEEIFERGLSADVIQRIKSAQLLENPRGGDNNELIEHFAPASGIFLLRRKTALVAGGYDEQFLGWGGEDRDLAFRLIALPGYSQKIQLPTDFALTKPWNLNDTVVYEGWRALYRMNGDYAAAIGLQGYHLFHDRMPWRSDKSKQNITFATEKAKKIFEKKIIQPLSDDKLPVDIILGRNPHIQNSQLFDVIPNPVVIDEAPSVDPAFFAQSILSRRPNTVTMWNPYGTSWRLAVYKELRAADAPIVVGERGALPRSFYFDVGGLSVESDTYQEQNWDDPISDEDRIAVETYIEDLRSGSSALEAQNNRVGTGLLRLQLGVSPEEKIIVVPLQLFDDTVTTYFSEANRSYSDYIGEVRKIAGLLPHGWKLVYKNHPLAREKYAIENAIAADSAHINDLLELADAVIVFNSGTGLLAMAFEKPTFIYGRTFYGITGVNNVLQDADSFIGTVKSGLPPVDFSKVKRFYHFLTQKFYSFADVENTLKKQTEKSNRVVLQKLFYTRIVFPGQEPRSWSNRSFDLRTSTLFDRFRHFDYAAKNTPAKFSVPREIVSSGLVTPAKVLPPDPVVSKLPIYRKPAVHVVRPFVKLIGSHPEDVTKFNADPRGYFAKLKNPRYRLVGKVLFGG